jgi:hypothetical protein
MSEMYPLGLRQAARVSYIWPCPNRGYARRTMREQYHNVVACYRLPSDDGFDASSLGTRLTCVIHEYTSTFMKSAMRSMF